MIYYCRFTFHALMSPVHSEWYKIMSVCPVGLLMVEDGFCSQCWMSTPRWPNPKRRPLRAARYTASGLTPSLHLEPSSSSQCQTVLSQINVLLLHSYPKSQFYITDVHWLDDLWQWNMYCDCVQVVWLQWGWMSMASRRFHQMEQLSPCSMSWWEITARMSRRKAAMKTTQICHLLTWPG